MFKNSVYEIIEIVELEEWDFKDFIFYDDNNNVLFSSLAENKFIIFAQLYFAQLYNGQYLLLFSFSLRPDNSLSKSPGVMP